MSRVEFDLARKAKARATFTDCAARYIEQSGSKRSIDVIKTLEPLIKARLASGAGATTINRSLEVVRTILNRAALRRFGSSARAWLSQLGSRRPAATFSDQR